MCDMVQVEDQSQPFYARATMDRECPYDPTALSFRVSHTCTHENREHKASL